MDLTLSGAGLCVVWDESALSEGHYLAVAISSRTMGGLLVPTDRNSDSLSALVNSS
jgi:hypothetical protein